jgi:hypothetical protein
VGDFEFYSCGGDVAEFVSCGSSIKQDLIVLGMSLDEGQDTGAAPER